MWIFDYRNVLLVAFSWGEGGEGELVPGEVVTREGHCPVGVQGINWVAELEEDALIWTKLVSEPATCSDGFILEFPLFFMIVSIFKLHGHVLCLFGKRFFYLFLGNKDIRIIERFLQSLLLLQEAKVRDHYFETISCLLPESIPSR